MLRFLLAALLIISPLLAQAQAPADSLSRCLADNTSGKDRKDLARWVFLAMAAHPEIRQYASANLAQAMEEMNKVTASTFTRLLTESCSKQTQEAFKQGGAMAIQLAFQTLGQLAMQEIMSDNKVKATMSAFQKHIDQNKLNQVLSAK